MHRDRNIPVIFPPGYRPAPESQRPKIYQFSDEQRELVGYALQQFRDSLPADEEARLGRRLDDIAVALGYSLTP